MTRKEAIAIIEQMLPSLDDEAAMALAEMAQSLAQSSVPSPDEPFVMRKLTDEELRLIEQSKEDFRQGRTYSLSEARAMTDAFLAKLDTSED
jgi:hypothetical protein